MYVVYLCNALNVHNTVLHVDNMFHMPSRYYKILNALLKKMPH